MEVREQPDRFGRIAVMALALWSAVGLAVYVAFRIVFPAHGASNAHLDQQPQVTTSRVFDVAGARPVIRAPSACDPDERAKPVVALLAELRAWLDGAELPADPTVPRPHVDGQLRQRGAKLFASHCAICHGTTGNGKGAGAAELATRPRDFTTGTYELRTTEHDSLPTDADIFRAITRGVHGTSMPPWFVLAETDRWALVAYVKSLSKQFDEDSPSPPLVVAKVPAEIADRVARGHQVYDKGGCSSCHGAVGRGDGPAAGALRDASGAPIRPRDLTQPRYHRSSRLADIYRTLETGLDGTPMAGFSKVLPPDDVWDVAMYVRTLAPHFTDTAASLRCPDHASTDAEELIGVSSLVHTLHPH